MKKISAPTLYGLLAEFRTPEDLRSAAGRTSDEGYVMIEAYSPFPIHGLASAMRYEHRKLPLLVLVGGIIGGLTGFFLQYYASVIDYPLNIAGRPENSWPAFVVVTFEMTILGASLTAVFGMLALNGLPKPYHPVFHVPEFHMASQDRFFLSIQARDPKFDLETARSFLRGLGAVKVTEVPT